MQNPNVGHPKILISDTSVIRGKFIGYLAGLDIHVNSATNKHVAMITSSPIERDKSLKTPIRRTFGCELRTVRASRQGIMISSDTSEVIYSI